MTKLSAHLEENITYAKELFPISKSFDIITRDLYLGETKGYWMGINGMCRTDVLQQIFSDLQNPLYMLDHTVDEIQRYMMSKPEYKSALMYYDVD